MLARTIFCHFAAAVLGCFIITPVLIMATDNRPCISIDAATFDPPEAAPGEVMTMTYSAQEFRACGGYVVRRFVDSANVVHETLSEPTNYHNSYSTEKREFSVKITVPLMPPGTALYTPVVYRWRNSVQELFPLRDPYIPQMRFTVLPTK